MVAGVAARGEEERLDGVDAADGQSGGSGGVPKQTRAQKCCATFFVCDQKNLVVFVSLVCFFSICLGTQEGKKKRFKIKEQFQANAAMFKRKRRCSVCNDKLGSSQPILTIAASLTLYIDWASKGTSLTVET